MAKKVIYLFGAGATQAVVQDIDLDFSLMTWDIQKYIVDHCPSRGITEQIWNELATVEDVEQLISVLEAQSHYPIANTLRRFYQKALIELAKKPINSDSTTLYTILSELHLEIISNLPSEKDELEERLLCFMTLNYEDILERSIQKLELDIDYGVKTTYDNDSEKVTVLKLHGSFNWENCRPIKIRSMNALVKPSKALWIPPGVEKKQDQYPFNLLWGKATEFLMDCDILRVVGCSLSYNDWGLIPILYSVQRLTEPERKIQIEIIDYVDTGKKIEENYDFDVKKITDIDEIKSYYKEDDKSIHDIDKHVESIYSDKEKTNAFKAWLEAKIGYLVQKEVDIPKESLVYKFYHKTDG